MPIKFMAQFKAELTGEVVEIPVKTSYETHNIGYGYVAKYEAVYSLHGQVESASDLPEWKKMAQQEFTRQMYGEVISKLQHIEWLVFNNENKQATKAINDLMEDLQ